MVVKYYSQHQWLVTDPLIQEHFCYVVGTVPSAEDTLLMITDIVCAFKDRLEGRHMHT